MPVMRGLEYAKEEGCVFGAYTSGLNINVHAYEVKVCQHRDEKLSGKVWADQIRLCYA